MYHLGNSKANPTAKANASVVCPDGNDGLPPTLSFSINGYISYGRGKSIEYFKMLAIIAEMATGIKSFIALFLNTLFLLMKEIIKASIGIPNAK